MNVYEAEPVHGRPKQGAGTLIEQLLSPQALQRMMAAGGGLLVVGLVGWLWSIGIFENPIIIASTLGTITLGALGLGAWLHGRTQHKLAGSGITLLAELALPLNLWLYDAQGLITISEGGRLWIPAAVCCGIYAFIARVLRRPVFVYTLVGGIVMTGLLFLADASIGRFWQLMPPVSFLVVAGWLCIFAERLFPSDAGDFSKENFGAAFHRSGLAVLASGLLLLAGGQCIGFLNSFFPFDYVPAIAASRDLKAWALVVVGGSFVASMVQRLLTPSARGYGLLAAGLLSWCGVMVLDVFSVSVYPSQIGIVVGGMLVANFVRLTWFVPAVDDKRDASLNISYACTLFLFGYGVLQFFATYLELPIALFDANSWVVISQLATTGAACLGGWFAAIHCDPSRDLAYAKGIPARTSDSGPTSDGERSTSQLRPIADALLSGASVMGICCAAISGKAMGLTSLFFLAPVLFTVPSLFAVASWATKSASERRSLRNAMSLANLLALVYLGTAFLLGNVHAAFASWTWTGIFASAAVTFFLGGHEKSGNLERVLSGICATFAVILASIGCGFSVDHAVVLTPTLFGLGLLGVRYLRDMEQLESPASALVLIGALLGTLLGICRTIGGEVSWGLFVLFAVQVASLAIASLISKQSGWRASFRGAAIALVATTLAALNSIVGTHWLIRVELGTVALGVFLLVIGHLGWYREGDGQDDGATLALWMGSLCTALPLAIGILYYRYSHALLGWALFHNVVGLLAAIILLTIGFACRIRSTTLGGTGLMATYIVSLAALIRIPSQLQSVSVVMMVAGGSFFTVAVLLSLYRDRLIKIQSDMSEKRGVFRVLQWR